MAIEIYVVPTITNDKILPTSSIPSDYLSNDIIISGCPGEYVPATFVIKAVDEDIFSLTPTPSDLGTIPASAVDLYAVKCWYQARGGKHLTPELLLKDDSLVNVENGENYLKMLDGSYMWISDPTPTTNPDKRWSIDEIAVQDADTLQPVDIYNGTNKQFWVLVKIPTGTEPGVYSSTIELITPDVTYGNINVTLEVLPIELLDTYLEYGIYYTARIGEASISSQRKDAQQLRAEYRDMIEHGITSPTLYQGVYQPDPDIADIEQHLNIRNEMGLQNKPLYWIEHGPNENVDPARIPNLLAAASRCGIDDVYFYGIDEALSTKKSGGKIDLLLSQRPEWEEIHQLGVKIFTAGVRVGHYSGERSVGEFGVVGDLLDLLVCYGHPSTAEAARWHGAGHRIFSYADPVVGEEKPETYRRNYGLSLWQGDYDGTMPWGYNYAQGNPWNPFDASMDQMFGRPTINGVVDNLAFEGWREGVTDTRYLTTLLNAIDVAKARGKDTSEVENYLNNLKSVDLKTKNLQEVRQEMKTHILDLQGEPVAPPAGNAALRFNGFPPGGVNCGNKEGLNLTDELTIEIWVKPEVGETEQDANAGPICKASADAGWSWQLRYRSSDSPEGWLGFQFNGVPEGPTWVSTKQNLIPGEKYYIVGRAKRNAEGLLELTCFVNGQPTDSAVITAISGSAAPLLIGQDGWDSIFNGVVDEVRYSDIGRSDAEISVNWNNGEGRKLAVDQHTVALWHMDEGQGNVIYDGTENDNDGTIIGATWVKGFFPLEATAPIFTVLWSILPYFPWEGPPLPRFTGRTWQ